MKQCRSYVSFCCCFVWTSWWWLEVPFYQCSNFVWTLWSWVWLINIRYCFFFFFPLNGGGLYSKYNNYPMTKILSFTKKTGAQVFSIESKFPLQLLVYKRWRISKVVPKICLAMNNADGKSQCWKRTWLRHCHIKRMACWNMYFHAHNWCCGVQVWIRFYLTHCCTLRSCPNSPLVEYSPSSCHTRTVVEQSGTAYIVSSIWLSQKEHAGDGRMHLVQKKPAVFSRSWATVQSRMEPRLGPFKFQIWRHICAGRRPARLSNQE